MIFVSTDHLNFAQGELSMFSAFLCWQFAGLGRAVLDRAAGRRAVLVHARRRSSNGVILRPLHNAPVLSVVVVFIGLLTIFHSMAGGIWGHTIKAFPSPFPQASRSRARPISARTRSA